MNKMKHFMLNEKIELYFENAGGDQRMEGIISDVSDEDVSFSIPADDKQFKLLPVGQQVYGIVYAKNKTAGFKAIVKDRSMSHTPTYILSRIKEISKVQRRKFVRVSISTDIKYTFDEKLIKRIGEYEDSKQPSDELGEGIMIDLSAGGTSFSCRDDVPLGARCMILFGLEGKSFCLYGKTARKEIIAKEKGFKYIYGIMFDEMEECLKEEIIRLLFKVMRRNAKR